MDASIKMRKCGDYRITTLIDSYLQCGRIHKDAEIRSYRGMVTTSTRALQCGRIHKDAEISTARNKPGTPSTFNVAASIKMRKFNNNLVADENGNILQCGRIHKDAEITSAASFRCSRSGGLQCGRIHKDAEMNLAGAYLRL